MAEKKEEDSKSLSADKQEISISAYLALKKGQYDSSIINLKKLQKNHPGDFKLMHNRAIAEFYKSGQTKTSDLKKNLAKVHKVTQQCHQEEDEITEDNSSAEYSTLHFNQALLYFKFHQYLEAQSLLVPIAENVESMYLYEILLLLAEIYLVNYESEKAGQIINRIETSFSKVKQARTSVQETKEKMKQRQTDHLPYDEQGRLQDVSQYALWLKSSLPLLKTRCCLQMKSMKACKREIKAFSSHEGTSSFSSNNISMTSVFLKSNFEFLRGNYHKAYKLLGSSSPSAVMNAAKQSLGECPVTMYYNNLGVIHFHMGKYNLGTFYMTKAIEENDKSISIPQKKNDGKQQQQVNNTNAKTLQMINMNKKFELLYNTGIQLLFSGKPSAAFDCLIVAAQVFYSNPRLWLRLAECCIQANCSSNNSQNHAHGDNSNTGSGHPAYSTVGSGIHQKIIVNPPSKQWSGSGNSVMPGVTIEFASVCLQNALTILNEFGVGNSNGKLKQKSSLKDESTSEIGVPCFPGPPVSGQELNNLYASVLINSSFIALDLGNNLMAYEYSKALLELTHLSGRQRYLGRMYMAEALVCLDRIADAIQQLSSDIVTDISNVVEYETLHKNLQQNEDKLEPSEGKQESPYTLQTCFKSVQHAQACMLINLAIAHSLRSEFEKAEKLLMQVATLIQSQDIPPNAILLAVYINLHLPGGLQTAVKILQQNSMLPKSAIKNPQPTTPSSWPQMPSSNLSYNTGMKQFAAVAANIPLNVPGPSLSSNGSTSGGSSGSRSKSSTPQPQFASGPPSGSVTPERMVKSTPSIKSDNGSAKSKRGRR